MSTAFSLLASWRIFEHLLRRPQPTFVACYSLLLLAGAIVPALSSGLAPIMSLCLWSVFAVGAIKVHRHLSWLAEEHRLPRVCGFSPIWPPSAHTAAETHQWTRKVGRTA